MSFKLNDKVKLLTDFYEDQDSYQSVPKGSILTVVADCRTLGQWIDQTSVQLDFLNPPYNHEKEFELVEEEKVQLKVPKFCRGDKVILTNPKAYSGHGLEEGWIGYVLSPNDGSDEIPVQVATEESNLVYFYFDEDELELLSAGQTAVPSQQISPDIARPILEERKIGKVKMELFDEGFPNAIMEIARVMTWAALHKGYKPHDWKNLPNADTEFSAAASRHKVKGFIQKVEGVEPLQRTDEESKITHLAHQAFNVLAELELVLTGKIK